MANEKILIAEDDNDAACLVRDALVPLGYDVEIINNLATIKGRIQHAPPDALILDEIMPGGDCSDIIRWIRTGPFMDLPIVVLREAIPDDVISRCGNFEDMNLLKPFDPQADLIPLLNLLFRAAKQEATGTFL